MLLNAKKPLEGKISVAGAKESGQWAVGSGQWAVGSKAATTAHCLLPTAYYFPPPALALLSYSGVKWAACASRHHFTYPSDSPPFSETMAKVSIPSADDSDEPIEIELKQPWLGGLLAWLVPGLGHLYQGRTGKGLLFFVCVMGTFLYGLSVGEGKVVYASTRGQKPFRWQYYCQLGIGVPALPAWVQTRRANNRQDPLWQTEGNPRGFMAPPRNHLVESKDDSGNESRQPNELAKWIVESTPNFELGTMYTVVAGLLNILVICDAIAGPLVIVPKQNENSEDEHNNSA